MLWVGGVRDGLLLWKGGTKEVVYYEHGIAEIRLECDCRGIRLPRRHSVDTK